MNEFELTDILIDPGGAFVSEVALAIEYDRLSFLPVYMSGNDPPPDQIAPVSCLVVRVRRDVDDVMATVGEKLAKAIVV